MEFFKLGKAPKTIKSNHSPALPAPPPMFPHLSCFKHPQDDDSTLPWAPSKSIQIQALLADVGLELGSLEADAVWDILSSPTLRAGNARFQQKIPIPAQCLWNTKREFFDAFLLSMKFLKSSAQTSTGMETRGRKKVLGIFFLLSPVSEVAKGTYFSKISNHILVFCGNMLAGAVIHSDKSICNGKRDPQVKKYSPALYWLLRNFRRVAAFSIDCQCITLEQSQNSSSALLPIIKIGVKTFFFPCALSDFFSSFVNAWTYWQSLIKYI